MRACPICKGTGQRNLDGDYEFESRPAAVSRCLFCDGSGQIKGNEQLIMNNEQGIIKEKDMDIVAAKPGNKNRIMCHTCVGLDEYCPTCDGKGYLSPRSRVKHAQSGRVEEYRKVMKEAGFKSGDWVLMEKGKDLEWRKRRKAESGKRGTLTCGACKGTGKIPGPLGLECPTCQGRCYVGTLSRARNIVTGQEEQYRFVVKNAKFDQCEWIIQPPRVTTKGTKGTKMEGMDKMDKVPRQARDEGQARTHVPTEDEMDDRDYMEAMEGQGPAPKRTSETHVPTEGPDKVEIEMVDFMIKIQIPKDELRQIGIDHVVTMLNRARSIKIQQERKESRTDGKND